MAKVGTAVFYAPVLTRNTRKDEQHEGWRVRIFRAFCIFVWFVLKTENASGNLCYNDRK